MREPVATYRWQLTPDEGFDAAAAAVGDLAALGISHLYLSPVAEAVPGSAHGYDVVDPTRLRDELGGDDAFRRLAAACDRHGLGIVVDVVPNHLAAHPANPWWWDLLRLGRRSRWSVAFDVDWDPPKRELAEQILLPVLGDHYGRELEAGNLRVERGEGDGRLLVVRYHDHAFPVSPPATALLLAGAARRAGDDVLGVAARVLERVEDTAEHEAREADLLVAERTAAARLGDPSVSAALDAELQALHADHDALDVVLDRLQHYRLARWRVGHAELVYRRFFDVDTLVATRAERPAVFEALHRLPLRLLEEGLVDGLRIDHVDGLRDPTAYLERLRSLMPAGAWLLVEKIVRAGEDLAEGWPVDGTTGYEVADLLGAWLTDPDGADRLIALWRATVGEERSVEEVAAEARHLVLTTSLTADVERLTDALVRVCEGRRRHRDHSRSALRDALVEVAARAPAYRSYVRFLDGDPSRPVASPSDEAFVRAAVRATREACADLDPELLDLLEAVLLGRLRGPDEAEVALRFQQLTGPVAAKGEEDTALYRWLALPHRCEVGADPAVASADAEAWHAASVVAERRWPRRMTTLSTHDTKRAADVRARLAVLTTVPDEVSAAWAGWWARAGGSDPRAGWLVFHTLVGAHPLPADRAWTVVEKSLREAKLATSWTDVDEGYEAEVRELVRWAVSEPELGAPVAALAERVRDAGWAGALAQLLAQLLAPGVPDVYQGGEGWDLSLVDPDNRRPVDPGRRHQLVTAAAATSVAAAWADEHARADGRVRAALLRTALAARRRHDLRGYTPLAVAGPDAARVLAFARGDDLAVVATRPGPGARVEADATVDLPGGAWRDLLGGPTTDGELGLAGRALPLALLERH